MSLVEQIFDVKLFCSRCSISAFNVVKNDILQNAKNYLKFEP